MAPFTNYKLGRRAMNAMWELFGGGPAKARSWGSEIPLGAELPDRQMILIAGDQDRPLALKDLRSVARETRWDVIGTYVEQYQYDHDYDFDIVLVRSGQPKLYRCLRLWLPATTGELRFVAEDGTGPVLGFGKSERLEEVADDVLRGRSKRRIGLARGKTRLQALIYS